MAIKKTDLNGIDRRLSDLYSSSEDKEQTYDRWASTYESDLVNDMDYVAHKHAAKLFREYVIDFDARVLDVACGTGLVGEELKSLGYRLVDGTDFSSEMLRAARERGVYQETFKHDFTQPLDLTDRYDALICVGLFAFNEPQIKDLIHVLNTVKSAHYCIVTVNGAAWRELELEKVIRQEAKKHDFEITKIVKTGYIQGEGIDGRVLVIRSPERS